MRVEPDKTESRGSLFCCLLYSRFVPFKLKASLNVNQIDVSDIAGAQYYRTAPPAPGESRRKKRKKK